jgi:CubicO group peptidase (beta-lactamase class C family)
VNDSSAQPLEVSIQFLSCQRSRPRPRPVLRTTRVLCILLFILLPRCAFSFEWQTALPEKQGFDPVKLRALQERLAAQETKALLVIRRDAIVLEWYGPDHGPDKKYGTASLAKALVGGVCTAIALTDGRVKLDDPVAKFVPSWRSDPRKAAITLRHLGSHTSGLEDAEADGLPHEQLTGWKGDFWKRLEPPQDAFTISRDIAPVLFTPGEKWQYSNPGLAMLSYVLTEVYRADSDPDLRGLLRERVMWPIGVPASEWTIGYGRTYRVSGLPLVASWGGANFTARAAARVGRLMLREGDWDGKRLLSAEAVRAVTHDVGTPGPNGIGWWSNQDGFFPKVPRDAFWGAGAGHQVLLVIPSLNLIAVRQGQKLKSAAKGEEPFAQEIFEPLLDALLPGIKP